MLDGISKDICFSLAIFLSVLLTAKHNGLGSIDLVDAITGHPLQETRASVEQSSCGDSQEQSDRWARNVSQHWAGRV